MNRILSTTMAAALVWIAGTARAVESVAAITDTERQTREEVFEFTDKPTVKKSASGWTVGFSSKSNCDVTVAIVDQNNKIVRHLACGVLGKNAPSPFKQNALIQSIEWDGKDDFGKPAPAGCKVKVSLGLTARYDKVFSGPLGTTGDGVGIACGLAVDKIGSVYLVQNFSVRRYTRDGKYERRLFPPPASIATPEKFAPYRSGTGGIDYIETVWGDKAMVQINPKQPWSGFCSWSYGSNQPLGTPAIGPNGQIAFAYESAHNKGTLFIMNQDGSMPAGAAMSLTFAGRKLTGDPENVSPIHTEGGNRGAGAHHMATSPDGQWLYISQIGYTIGRVKWADLKGPMLQPEIFKGEIKKPGNDNDHFALPAGVACDRDGNVLVADPYNDRIQVYKPDGAYLATVATTRPQSIAVHPKTGAIYVMSWDMAKGSEKPPVFVRKLSGWKDGGKEQATMEVKSTRHYYGFSYNAMTLDAASEPAALWVWDATGLFKMTDKGNAFERGENVGTDKVDPSVIAGPGSFGWDKPRIIVDRAREELYLGSGDVYRAEGVPWIRCDGRTGKKDPGFAKKGCDLAVGPDDLIYMRAGASGQFVVRYTRDGTPVPFKSGIKVHLSPDGSIMGVEPKDKDADYVAIFVASTRSSKIWQPGFAVGANGDVWVWANEQVQPYLNAVFDGQGKTVPPEQFEKTDWAAICDGRDKTPLRPAISKLPNGGDRGLIMVWDRDGRPKCMEAVGNTQKGQCLRLDSQGNLYYLNQFSYSGKKGVGIECFKNSPISAGMLVKIASKGSWPMARVLPRDAKATMPGLTNLTHREFPIEGVTWAIPNADDIFTGCQCHMHHFDLDSFARSFLPVVVLNSVLVYDTNGNQVVRLGRYGNEDSQGPGSPAPDPEIGVNHVRTVAVSDEALYVADEGTDRTLRAKLAYQIEEIVPLVGK